MSLSLTIGMAAYDDHDMAAMTLHSLMVHHAEIMPQCEILLVDNHPVYSQPQSQGEKPTTRYERMLGWLAAASPVGGQGLVGKVTYIPMAEPTGTSAPREKIFLEASAPNVLCMDAHVLIPSGVLGRLVKWYESNPETADFYQGPMVMDNHFDTQEAFSDFWRDSMWGMWEADPRGKDVNGQPFEITAMGLGLFTCRKDAWIRWPEGLTGFGGEEHNVHLLWRESGRKTVCLPWLRWWHLFRDGSKGQPYPNVTWQRVRNYVLWAKHIGKISPERERELIKRAGDHFVGRQMHPPITVDDWNRLVADPLATVVQPSQPNQEQGKEGKAGCQRGNGQVNIPPAMRGIDGRQLPPPEFHTIEGLYQWVRDTPRDLNKHWRKVKELAKQCDHVTAFVKRREWLPVLAAGNPGFIVVHCTEHDPMTQIVHAINQKEPLRGDQKRTISTDDKDSIAVRDIDDTDMVVLAQEHGENRVYDELVRFAPRVRRWVLVQGTGAFGKVDESGQGGGLLAGIHRYMAEHPEWKIVYRNDEQYGISLLSKDPMERTVERGPGFELHAILESFGITPAAGCQCIARAKQMDEWGPAKCREEMEKIVGWMEEAYAKKWEEVRTSGVGEKAGMAAKFAWGALKSVFTGLAFRAMSVRGLVEEAIRRAEEKDKEWEELVRKERGLVAEEEVGCVECGLQLSVGDDKCPYCGTKVEKR